MRRGLLRAGGGAGLFILLLAAGSPRLGQAGTVRSGDAPLTTGGIGQPVLIRIATDDRASLGRLGETGAPAVSVRDGYALAWGPASSIPLIRSRGIQADSLAERHPGHDYAFVYTDGGGRAGKGAPLESLGKILFRGPHTAVLEYPAGKDQPIWESYPFVRVSDRPIDLPPAHPALRRSVPPVLDPLIAAYVEEVDATNLNERVADLQAFRTRRSDNPQGRLAQDYIHQRFVSYGLTDVTDFEYNPTWCDDVVAVQRGTVAPDEIYVIGGHYDSFAFGSGNAPGADDNASGSVAVLEAARILAQREFEATIVYIAFSGEEQGLKGSWAWANQAKRQELDIRAMLNLDMIGYVEPGKTADLDLIYRPESSWIRDLVVQVAGTYLPDFPVVDGSLTTGDSDHSSFNENGYHALLFFEDSRYETPYIHTPQDVIGLSLNDFDFMRRNVQAAIATLATMARPLRIRIDHTPLGDPPVSAEGYPVVARIRSTAPLATDSIRVRYAVDRGEFTWIPMTAVEDQPEMYEATIPKQAPGRMVQYAIHARDIEGRVGEVPLQGTNSFTVGLSVAFADSFGTDQGWLVGAAGDSAVTGIWVRAVPVATEAQPGVDASGDPGGFCFVTENGVPGGESGAADVDGGRTSLTSPRLDLARAIDVRIQYACWYVDDTRPDDTLRVYLSNDDGATWKLVDSVGRSGPEWTIGHIQGMGLIPPPTDQMRLRFVAEDVGGSSLVEAAIDNVIVKAVILPPEPPPVATRLINAGPLPMRSGRGSLRILYDMSSNAPASLHVYDILGRRIASLREVPYGVGQHEAAWDGRDDEGRSVPGGVYFLRLSAPGESASTVRVPVVP